MQDFLPLSLYYSIVLFIYNHTDGIFEQIKWCLADGFLILLWFSRGLETFRASLVPNLPTKSYQL